MRDRSKVQLSATHTAGGEDCRGVSVSEHPCVSGYGAPTPQSLALETPDEDTEWVINCLDP